MGCHGLNAVSGLIIPDLRGSAYLHDADGWNDVVLDGRLAERGMAAHRKWLSEEQSLAIQAYVIQQAHRGKVLLDAQAAVESP